MMIEVGIEKNIVDEFGDETKRPTNVGFFTPRLFSPQIEKSKSQIPFLYLSRRLMKIESYLIIGESQLRTVR